jgi:DNA-binding MarR family transcriptional regulator
VNFASGNDSRRSATATFITVRFRPITAALSAAAQRTCFKRCVSPVRELRRVGGSQQFRQRAYSSDRLALEPGQHDALDTVVTLGRPRMSELATNLRVDRSTATRTIARLERQGLVQCRIDSADGRNVVVAATPRGIRRQQQLMERGRTAFVEIFSKFDDERLASSVTSSNISSPDSNTSSPSPMKNELANAPASCNVGCYWAIRPPSTRIVTPVM